MKINVKKVRDANWRLVYQYDGQRRFRVYDCEIPGLTRTCDFTRSGMTAGTSYRAFGQTERSLSRLVTVYNTKGKKR